jgi:glycosyltransferase involved in cell wall biosynthesis
MTETSISLGVVIPTFIDSEEALFRLNSALDSVLTQNYSPRQIVVTDDSADNFSERVFELCESKNATNLEFIRHLGSPGVSTNSNNGLRFINTDFVHCLHQDDYLRNPDCYSSVAIILNEGEYSWVLLGGAAAGSRVIPRLRNGRIPAEINFGINTIGGPSAVIFPKKPDIKFSENLSMLCDIDLFLNLQDWLGEPCVIESSEVEYQMGGWQLQKRISNVQVLSELLELNSMHKGDLGNSLRYVFTYRHRQDVKLRALKVMSELNGKTHWAVIAAVYELSIHARSLIGRFLRMRKGSL